jgi:hypothetical protein
MSELPTSPEHHPFSPTLEGAAQTTLTDLPLTHDFLSMMLGVRRPGVTIAVQNLEGNRLIRAKRGHITVLDRTGLEGVADSAYGASEAEYARVMAAA